MPMSKYNNWKVLEKQVPKFEAKLGATFDSTTQEVVFSIWAPSAQAVSVLIFSDGKIKEPSYQFQLNMNLETGVWSITCAMDISLDGWFYEYEITNDKGTVKCLDPYAKSMSAYLNDGTAGRAAIINTESKKYLPEGGWTDNDSEQKASKLPVFDDYSKAIVYEISVRDATISPDSPEKNALKRGTYEGFCSILPYLSDLGITHIQLMPVMNFCNNNEVLRTFEDSGTTHSNNYNWGYDPHNYFTPEGWYSSDATNPYARISELKTLIKQAHNHGLRVILDCVYNHMGNSSYLDDIVPGYYFRLNKDCSFTSNSGCGNDVASEHKMAKKLIIDSILYWVKEFHVDGFRFDLMGLLDSDTVMTAYEKSAEIKKDILFIGEGWKMYNGEKGTVGMDQNYMMKTDKVAVFNDEFRDLCKAGGMNETGKGFLTGQKVFIPDLFCNCSGKPVHNYSVKKPSSNVQYLECHDGLTLHDCIVNNLPIDETAPNGPALVLNRLKLANALLLTSQGIAFLHAGQEKGRTKPAITTANTKDSETIGRFVKNSYDSSDSINALNWDLSDNNKKLLEYTKKLIMLRKKFDVFTIKTQEEAMKQISLLGQQCSDFLLAYKINDNNSDWYLYFNSGFEHKKVNFSNQVEIEVFVDSENVYLDGKTIKVQEYIIPESSTFICRIKQ